MIRTFFDIFKTISTRNNEKVVTVSDGEPVREPLRSVMLSEAKRLGVAFLNQILHFVQNDNCLF